MVETRLSEGVLFSMDEDALKLYLDSEDLNVTLKKAVEVRRPDLVARLNQGRHARKARAVFTVVLPPVAS